MQRANFCSFFNVAICKIVGRLFILLILNSSITGRCSNKQGFV